MFGWIRSIGRAFADPFTGDALVANSEYVSIPKEVSVNAPAIEIPRVAQRIASRRKIAARTHHLGSMLIGCAVVAAVLLSGTESMHVLIGLLLVVAALAAIGLGLHQRSRNLW